MTLKDLNISERIRTDKTKSEIAQSVSGYKDKRKIELLDNGFLIYGKTSYNYEFLNQKEDWKITVKPKKIMSVILLIFLLTWPVRRQTKVY